MNRERSKVANKSNKSEMFIRRSDNDSDTPIGNDLLLFIVYLNGLIKSVLPDLRNVVHKLDKINNEIEDYFEDVYGM